MDLMVDRVAGADKPELPLLANHAILGVILELYRVSAGLVVRAVPLLAEELLTGDTQRRRLATRLVCHLATHVHSPPEEPFGQQYPRVFAAFLKRAADKDLQIRMLFLDFLASLIETHESAEQCRKDLVNVLYDRLRHDPAEEVREKACKVGGILVQNKAGGAADILRVVSRRLLDKKARVRVAALSSCGGACAAQAASWSGPAGIQLCGIDCTLFFEAYTHLAACGEAAADAFEGLVHGALLGCSSSDEDASKTRLLSLLGIVSQTQAGAASKGWAVYLSRKAECVRAMASYLTIRREAHEEVGPSSDEKRSVAASHVAKCVLSACAVNTGCISGANLSLAKKIVEQLEALPWDRELGAILEGACGVSGGPATAASICAFLRGMPDELKKRGSVLPMVFRRCCSFLLAADQVSLLLSSWKDGGRHLLGSPMKLQDVSRAAAVQLAEHCPDLFLGHVASISKFLHGGVKDRLTALKILAKLGIATRDQDGSVPLNVDTVNDVVKFALEDSSMCPPVMDVLLTFAPGRAEEFIEDCSRIVRESAEVVAESLEEGEEFDVSSCQSCASFAVALAKVVKRASGNSAAALAVEATESLAWVFDFEMEWGNHSHHLTDLCKAGIRLVGVCAANNELLQMDPTQEDKISAQAWLQQLIQSASGSLRKSREIESEIRGEAAVALMRVMRTGPAAVTSGSLDAVAASLFESMPFNSGPRADCKSSILSKLRRSFSGAQVHSPRLFCLLAIFAVDVCRSNAGVASRLLTVFWARAIRLQESGQPAVDLAVGAFVHFLARLPFAESDGPEMPLGSKVAGLAVACLLKSLGNAYPGKTTPKERAKDIGTVVLSVTRRLRHFSDKDRPSSPVDRARQLLQHLVETNIPDSIQEEGATAQRKIYLPAGLFQHKRNAPVAITDATPDQELVPIGDTASAGGSGPQLVVNYAGDDSQDGDEMPDAEVEVNGVCPSESGQLSGQHFSQSLPHLLPETNEPSMSETQVEPMPTAAIRAAPILETVEESESAPRSRSSKRSATAAQQSARKKPRHAPGSAAKTPSKRNAGVEDKSAAPAKTPKSAHATRTPKSAPAAKTAKASTATTIRKSSETASSAKKGPAADKENRAVAQKAAGTPGKGKVAPAKAGSAQKLGSKATPGTRSASKAMAKSTPVSVKTSLTKVVAAKSSSKKTTSGCRAR